MANTMTAHREEDDGAKPPVPMTGRELRDARRKDLAEAEKRKDDALYNQATGVMDDETREKLLALGADITRASPVGSQTLPDAVAGLTTTTGAYRSPIDPTTAAVPGDPEDERIRRMARGFPTMGAGREGGKPEELFMERENFDDLKKPIGQGDKHKEPELNKPTSEHSPARPPAKG